MKWELVGTPDPSAHLQLPAWYNACTAQRAHQHCKKAPMLCYTAGASISTQAVHACYQSLESGCSHPIHPTPPHRFPLSVSTLRPPPHSTTVWLNFCLLTFSDAAMPSVEQPIW